MALGGGTFIAQNKILPGAYINFISLSSASATLSDRGVAAMGLELDWGIEDEVFEVTSGDFQKNSVTWFGYSYTHEKMKGLRDLFKNIRSLYAYRLNPGGEKAQNEYATAKTSGVRGNDLKVVVQANIDDPSLFDVKLFIDSATLLDAQTVSNAEGLKDNAFVVWDKEIMLTPTAGTSLSGGSNGSVTTENHQAFLNKVEAYSFNALGVVSETSEVNGLYAAFCKRMRDEIGVKFQTVVFNYDADYEGVVKVKNEVTDDSWSKAALIYWVTGAIAGCAVNASNLNKVYDGEFAVDVNYTQSQLETAIKEGYFMLHRVGTSRRVLADINSLTNTSNEKGEDFKDNQTIRVIDQIANDIAVIFNTKYLGKIPNDTGGRISLWSDIVAYYKELEKIRAIEDFNPENVQVEQGNSKKSVSVNGEVKPVNAMAQLYMSVLIG